MDTSLNAIKQLLKKEIGLDASTIGEATIRKFLGQRMRACKLNDVDAYYNLLSSDRNEVAALLETAVIPETWFFRDVRPFAYILNAIQSNPLKYRNNPCQILSIPCSTGEEPYSIAMYFLQAGIAGENFHIKAVDISQRALDIALQGYYGNNSFRDQASQAFIDQYFTLGNGQYLIRDTVRQCISFDRVNILDAKALPYDRHFDFILCRNLLIYFDINTKNEAYRNLHRILKDDGVLFIGHSEFGTVPKNLFANTGSNNAFGLVKYAPTPDREKTTSRIPDQRLNNPFSIPASTPNKPAQPEKPAFANFIPSPVSKTNNNNPDTVTTREEQGDLLERARQYADTGKLNDAEDCCLRHIEKNGDDCDSFFLLALINESAGKLGLAEDFYRKAIYLDPKHYPSLIHLALLLENNGDKKAAALLRQRAERAMKK